MTTKQITLRLPEELYELIKREAERKGTNINVELRNRLISDYQYKPSE